MLRVLVASGVSSGDTAMQPGTVVQIDFTVLASASSGATSLSPDNESAVDPNANAVLIQAFPGTLTVTAGLLRGCCPWVVPASASADGVGGSRWKTRLVIDNSGPSAMSVPVVFLEAGKDGTNAAPVGVSIAAGEEIVLDDVVLDLLGAPGKAGAIGVDADSNQLRVTSRTYNVGSACGTYGQGIPGLRLGESFVAGDSAWLFPVFADANAFRTNLGVVNASSLPATFTARLLDAKGVEKARNDLSLPPWSQTQVTNVLAAWAVTLVGGDGRIVLSSSTSGARFLAYLSVVDNGSGDPAYFPAEK